MAAFIMRSRYVSPAHQAQEGRQGAPLLEHRGESPDRRRPGGAAAAAVPGRDQRFAGTGLAQVNRHPGGRGTAAALSLFPEDRCEGLLPDASIVRLRLNELRLCRPRQWGGCWLALSLWRELELDRFWGGRLPPSRKGTRWDRVLLLLATYRLLAPGSEWRLHREWFERSAMADLLGEDLGLAEIHKLYRCHDRLLEHKQALFDHLVGRWRDLFNVSFDVLLYDLTSTYFESDPPFPEGDKRRHGYSRDHRGDCVQVIIALVVTPEGLPLAYEVLPGNTADNTTLRDFLARIERQYGKARRIWLMDRGIPTEVVLAKTQVDRRRRPVGRGPLIDAELRPPFPS